MVPPLLLPFKIQFVMYLHIHSSLLEISNAESEIPSVLTLSQTRNLTLIASISTPLTKQASTFEEFDVSPLKKLKQT
jgi:hypothetical protein